MGVAMILSMMTVGWMPADTVRAGDVTMALTVGTDTVDNFVVRGERRQLVATYVQEVSRIPGGYLIVEENLNPDGVLLTLDTIAVAEGTLATLWHGDVTPLGRRHVVFAAGRATGVATDTLGVETRVDTEVPAGLFDYSIMTLVADQLPLVEGMVATLATYDVTHGPVFVPMEVEGTESVAVGDGTENAWRVVVDVGRYQVTRWVSQATRKEIRFAVRMEGRQMVGEPR